MERVLKHVLPSVQIVSLDIVKQDHINILEDQREWTRYPDGGMYSSTPGTVKMLWVSPPCQHYSRAHTIGVINLKLADELVKRALLAIRHIQRSLLVHGEFHGGC